MPITYNPLLLTSVKAFEVQLERLFPAPGVEQATGVEHFDVALHLCSLSSEIRYRLGPPSRSTEAVVSEICDLLEKASSGIRIDEPGLNDKQRTLIVQFRDNMQFRANVIRQGRQEGSAA